MPNYKYGRKNTHSDKTDQQVGIYFGDDVCFAVLGIQNVQYCCSAIGHVAFEYGAE
jgi:hypothetical protein